ncbi:unnamed protein product, partial [Mesorhabditis spiculigera]
MTLPSKHASYLLRFARTSKLHLRQASIALKHDEPAATPNLQQLFEQQRARAGSAYKKMAITARVAGNKETQTFLMNQGVSTPYDVARHISRHLSTGSEVCVIQEKDGKRIASMHEPLNGEATIVFQEDSAELRQERQVLTGFLDIWFKITADVPESKDWSATGDELDVLTKKLHKEYINKEIDYEVQKVEADASQSDEELTLCRIGKHVFPIHGPVLANSGQLGTFSVTKASLKGGKADFRGIVSTSANGLPEHLWETLVNGIREEHNQE